MLDYTDIENKIEDVQNMDRYTIFHSNINSKDETLIVCKYDFNVPNALWDHWIDGSVTTNAPSLKEAVYNYFKALKSHQMSCAEGTSKQYMDRMREESAKRKKITREEAIKNIRKEMCRDCDYYYFDGNCRIDCYVMDSIKALERSSNNDMTERKRLIMNEEEKTLYDNEYFNYLLEEVAPYCENDN